MTTNSSQQRLRFDRAELIELDENQCRVDVSLTFAERTIKKSVVGEIAGLGPLKAAAAAALLAIEAAVEGRVRCQIADLDHVNALGKDLIALLVDVQFEGKEVQLFGSCRVLGSEMDTAVKAALNATNRFFELALRE
jgi:hypothetical protein